MQRKVDQPDVHGLEMIRNTLVAADPSCLGITVSH